jgi:hypothetical protein
VYFMAVYRKLTELTEQTTDLDTYYTIIDNGTETGKILLQDLLFTILPSPETGDIGKVLVVQGVGEIDWETIPTTLPSTSGASDGDALVVQGDGSVDWENITTTGNVPSTSGASDGDLLTVQADLSFDWETPTTPVSRGVSFLSVEALDNTDSPKSLVVGDVGKLFYIDATSDDVFVSLPDTSTLSAGDVIAVIRKDNSANSVNVTVYDDFTEFINGSTFESVTQWECVYFTYVGGVQWVKS